MMRTHSRNACRVAVVLARAHNAAAMTLEEVAADAEKLYFLGAKAREALERQRCARRHYRDAGEILAKYGGTVVDQKDLNGCVLGAKFNHGPRTGFRNVFFIS